MAPLGSTSTVRRSRASEILSPARVENGDDRPVSDPQWALRAGAQDRLHLLGSEDLGRVGLALVGRLPTFVVAGPGGG